MRRQFAQSLLVVAIAAPILTAITVARAQDLRIHTVYIVDYQTGSVMLDKNSMARSELPFADRPGATWSASKSEMPSGGEYGDSPPR